MGRKLRFLAPGGLVEVTSRTIHGRLLLQPNERIADLCRGVLARAARLYPVDVHAFAFLGNHYHLLLTVPDAQRLAQFMNYLNSNLAREVGRVVRWHERFWGRRYQAIPVTDEEASQVERLLYVLRQGCKEGLVRTPTEWPGATSTRALLFGEPIRGAWIDRTSAYQSHRKDQPADPDRSSPPRPSISFRSPAGETSCPRTTGTAWQTSWQRSSGRPRIESEPPSASRSVRIASRVGIRTMR